MSGFVRCDRAPEGWECTRERGHHGPCAAREVMCGASWDFYVTGHTVATRHVVCTLPRGHDGRHRGEVAW